MNDEDDGVDMSIDAAGFADWSEDNDTDITSSRPSQQQQQQQQQKEIEQSTIHTSEQLVELFVSVFGGTQHHSIEELVVNDKVKYEFDWKALMVKNIYEHIWIYTCTYATNTYATNTYATNTYAHTYIYSYICILIHICTHTYIYSYIQDKIQGQKDELLIISIINYCRRKCQLNDIRTSAQATVLFDDIISQIEIIRNDETYLQPLFDNDALLYSLSDYLGMNSYHTFMSFIVFCI